MEKDSIGKRIGMTKVGIRTLVVLAALAFLAGLVMGRAPQCFSGTDIFARSGFSTNRLGFSRS